jgi:hypothetical protein
MSYQEPPVPFRLLRATLGERDRRGYLVPYVTARAPSGEPITDKVDEAKVAACMRERRCQSCGEAFTVNEDVCLIDRPGTAWFAEGPLHIECAHYALGACPYLIGQAMRKLIEVTVCSRYVTSDEATAIGGYPAVPEDCARHLACHPEGTTKRLDAPAFAALNAERST